MLTIPRFSVSGTRIAMLAALILFAIALAGAAEAEGEPTITFVSEVGLISGDYVLNISLSDTAGIVSVTYWIDEGSPIEMTSTIDPYYEATIDTTTIDEGDHELNVKATDATGASIENSTTIAIDRNSPAVASLNADGILTSGDFVYMATAEDAYLNTSAVYAIIDGNEMTALDNGMTTEDDHFELVIDTTQLDDGGHFIRVWAFDLWGSHNKSQGIGFVVDNTIPSVEIISEGGVQSDEYIFTVAVTDPNLDVSTLTASVDGGDALALVGGDGEYEVAINTTELANGDVTITTTASDLVGNTNSTESITITVENLPDLPDLEVLSVEVDKNTIKEGGTFTIIITVKNVGDAASAGFTVSLMDGNETLSSVTETTGLDVGVEQNYTIDWKVAKKGEWTASVAVDNGDEVEETDETNNGLPIQGVLKVKAEPEDDSPGMGASMLLVAMTFALVVMRRRS
jgi:hypothetical protein